MNVLVAQIGARRHYAVPVALHKSGLLHAVYTDWCANRGLGAWVTSIIPRPARKGVLSRIADRRIPCVSSQHVETFGRHALWAAARRVMHPGIDSYQRWVAENRHFGESVVRHGFGRADTVYGFNGAAVEIFRQARRLGMTLVLDQTIAPWEVVESVLAEERERWPGWEDAEPAQEWRLLAEREAEEWELSDAIVCGSEFVAESLAAMGAKSERTHVVPYGYDAGDRILPGPQRANQTLRVLFVGTVELRKGIPYLWEAARRLGRAAVEVRVVGPIRVTAVTAGRLRDHVDLIGPVPRSRVQESYRWADVFVLPTLAEGSANVCYEAMSHGVPVITTPNAGSVVRDQQDGFLVAVREIDQLVDRLIRLIDDKDLLRRMSASAAARAAQFSWDRYHEQLPKVMQEALGRRSPALDTSVSLVKVP